MKTHQGPAPLTPAVLHILLALAGGERHGYEIMQRVRGDSQGRVRMGSGTLYGSIKRMLAAGLLAEAGERPDPTGTEERRRYYRLTDRGRRALSDELRRYHDLASLAAQRQLLARPGAEAAP